jgi:RimJ/RimL family protein N-acetyltransferase
MFDKPSSQFARCWCIGLGVSHANIPAQRVYENVGFELQANFTNYVEA